MVEVQAQLTIHQIEGSEEHLIGDDNATVLTMMMIANYLRLIGYRIQGT